MYAEFFGFTEKPFTITPNPKFIYLSRGHKEAFAHLLYGIQNHSGFIEITGEVGAGKTTILRTLFDQLEQDAYRLAFIFNPKLSALELLRNINREFGIACTSHQHDDLLVALNAFLLTENSAGRTVVLVIDEAQNLSPEVLEQIRLLSNLETETDKLIQIVLVGQPELGQMLNRNDLRQLSQRITVRYFLGTLDLEDSCRYVMHRLEVAGGKELVRFQPAALRTLYRLTRGLPRMINVLCDRALLIAYGEERHEVRAADIRLARRELRRDQASPLPRPRWSFIAAALLLPIVGLAWWLTPTTFAPTARTKVAVTTASQHDTATLRRFYASQDTTKNVADALGALLARWRVVAQFSSLSDPVAALAVAAEEHALGVVPVTGGIELLESLNAPALVRLILPGMIEARYLTVVGWDGERFSVAPKVDGRDSLTRAELAALWSGQAWMLWKNWRGIPVIVAPDTVGGGVTRLQEQLQRSGDLLRSTTGIYDPETIAAVTRLQERTGLSQDGRVGPRTLLRLYQESGEFPVPMLRDQKGTE